MCELFGMTASHPTDVNLSLALLKPRGGEIGPHADGWGVAFYEGRAARIFKEPIPAAESQCLAFISEYDFQSTMVIAHIRKANPGQFGRATANTHPFEREWRGHSWVFAHNGKLPGLRDNPAFAVRKFHPLGETDSEHAFCLLMDAIAEAGAGNSRMPSAAELIATIAGPVSRMAELGEFNFLLGNGDNLLAHAHSNLHALHRSCRLDGCRQDVVLLTTSPLTDEPWKALPPGGIHAYSGGQEVFAVADFVPPYVALDGGTDGAAASSTGSPAARHSG